MFIKPSKKWRNPEGNDAIMVPYTYYRLCESYREADGKVKQRTVLGLGELLDFPAELERKELADLLTEMINEGTFRLCDFLHRRVCSMFDIDESILLFDLTNTYFEGRMEDSELCRRGRSKEKRDDCKIVVLAAVVNKEGLLVRTEIR